MTFKEELKKPKYWIHIVLIVFILKNILNLETSIINLSLILGGADIFVHLILKLD